MLTALTTGTFIGRVATRVDTPSFLFSRMSASVPARDMPRHSHDSAYFFFVVRGRYATEAKGATGACGQGSVIFNPAGTTHRDHFVDPVGQFLIVGIPPELEGRVASIVPVSALVGDPGLARVLRDRKSVV